MRCPFLKYSNMSSMTTCLRSRKCFAHFDEELRGVVSPSDFREALRVFSVACEHDDDAEPLNEQQVDVMAANMNRDADNKVDYEEFLASLRVASLP